MIREAMAADQSSVQRLYELLCPGEPVDVRSDRIEQLRRDANNHLFVVVADGAVVATAFVTLCLDPMFGLQPYATVENVVVDATVRGRGIGSQLLEHVERFCQERNCSKIMLLSNAQRTRAHKFFKTMGYDDTAAKGFKKYFGGHTAARVTE